MRKLKLVLCMILCTAFTASAQENVYIGLHTKKNVRNLEVGVKKGTYQVWANGEPVMDLHEGGVIGIEAKRNSVKMVMEDTIIRRNFIIRFNSHSDDNMFTIRLNGIDTTLYRYDGDLLITASYHRLKLINIVDIQSYLAGVVKAEIGHLKEPEFLKAMSTVARTYVLKNKYRHENQGFDLCDRTHCQVYYGVLKISDAIIRSVESTRNRVIVDGKYRLVNTVFHSNSGGRTMASEAVWGAKVSYLKSKSDPYSLYGRHFQWQRKIPRSDWEKYLSRKTGNKVENFSCDTTFVRSKYYYCSNKAIPRTEVRKDWRLRSTYYIMEIEGDMVVFKGRGYGHGVGMSQEGANKMAQLGYSSEDIIKFYYTGVTVVNHKSWEELTGSQ